MEDINFFRNSVTTDKVLTAAELDALKEKWRKQHAGLGDGHRVIELSRYTLSPEEQLC